MRLSFFAIVIFALCCASCTTNHPVKSHIAPAPSVQTGALAQRIADTQSKVQSAGGHADRAIQVVEKIIVSADPATAAQLQEVRGELFRVKTDLREANEACTKAVFDREKAQEDADKLSAWGVGQQQTAEANAEGWRVAQAQSAARMLHVIRLQSMVGIALGIAAAIAGLKFFGPYGALAGPAAWVAAYFFA